MEGTLIIRCRAVVVPPIFLPNDNAGRLRTADEVGPRVWRAYPFGKWRSEDRRVTQRDHRQLPGISARGAWRLFNGVIWSGTGAILLGIVLFMIFLDAIRRSENLTLMIVVCIGTLILLVTLTPVGAWRISAFATVRQHAEVEAGYTTLLTSFDQVDGIDPRTGHVVRPAVARESAQASGITSGAVLGPLEVALTPWQVVLHRRGAVFWTALAALTVVVNCVLTTVYPDDDLLNILGPICLGVALLAAILIPIIAFQFGPQNYYLSQLRRAFPDAHAFAGRVVGTDLVAELLGTHLMSIPGARDRLTDYFVFDRERVILLSRVRTQLLPFLVIPRSSIHGSRSGSFYNGGGSTSTTAVLSITKSNGSQLDASFLLAPNRLSGPGTMLKQQDDSSRWVMEWAARR
ncbi:MAG: hypothetical protein JWQ39_395 [Glaciihabitans sp.]|nr:hypothetical protein [Glaciihabitans sp.]